MDTKTKIENQIKMFIHCGKCLDEVDETEGASPKNYARIGFGYTDEGIQVWCNRHETSIIKMHLPPSLRMNESCKCKSCEQKNQELLDDVF